MAVSRADAALIDFTLQSGGHTYTWTLDSEPTPDEFTNNHSFSFSDVEVAVDGVVGPNTALLVFFTEASGGGVNLFENIFGGFFVQTFGSQLFTGPTSGPTFVTGTFSLRGGVITMESRDDEDEPTDVPEPASMLLLGMGLAGAGIRRWRQKA